MFPTLSFRAASGPVSILWSLPTCRLCHESLSQTAARPCGLGDCGRELLAPCPEDRARPSRDDALSPSSILDRRQRGLAMGLGFIPPASGVAVPSWGHCWWAAVAGQQGMVRLALPFLEHRCDLGSRGDSDSLYAEHSRFINWASLFILLPLFESRIK